MKRQGGREKRRKKKKNEYGITAELLASRVITRSPTRNLPPSAVARTKRVEKVRVNLWFNKPELRETWIRSLSFLVPRLASPLLFSRLVYLFSFLSLSS